MTARQNVTDAPTVLAGITVDERYAIQNQGSSYVRVAVAGVAPDVATAPSFSVPPLGWLFVKAPSGESIWIWTPQGEASVVSYELAA